MGNNADFGSLYPLFMASDEYKKIIEIQDGWNWEKFRREASIKIMAAQLMIKPQENKSNIVKKTITLVDELIKQLKETNTLN